ncbi:MAG TPA: YfhO family protein, partial [Bacteroidota bacterium]|nr:YfhO family protein [Bacteroidota bacterium]
AGALLAAAVVLGMAIYAYEMLPTKEYAEYSVRGGGGEAAGGGASYEWATNWSLHPLELITYIVPSWFGFGAQVGLDWKGQAVNQFPGYWGWMPSTDNPPYIGIVPVILAIFALIYRRNRMTWFLAGFSVIVFFISFGRFLPVLYNLFYHYFPYFNKFRAPSLILFLIPLTVGLLGVYGMSWILDAGQKGHHGAGASAPDRKILKWVYVAAGVFVLTLIGKQVLFDMFPSSAFTKEGDPFNQQTMPVVREIRFELLWRDVLKVSGISVVLLGLIAAHLRRKIGAATMSVGIVALLVIDLAVIDQQFIHPRPKTDLQASLQADATMQFLKSDTTTFRVMALEQNLFRDNTLMNHSLQSVTGYSPAKLKIYQEMYDSALVHPVDPVMPVNMNVVRMMNAKYVISPTMLPPDRFQQVFADPAKKLVTYRTVGALRRAWFTDSVFTAGSKSEMYATMNSPEWQPDKLAILNEPVPEGITSPDSAWVQVTSFGAHAISLRAYTSTPGLMVLSEVYYPAGWTATVDGAETKIFRTNAVLRSVVVPAGEHEVKFVFDPESFRLGSTVTTAGWGVVLLLVAVGLFRDETIRGLLAKKG